MELCAQFKIALPPPLKDQAYVKITTLVAGTLTLPEYAFVTPVHRSIKHMVPCMCFLVEHPAICQSNSGSTEAPTRFMFDLGLRCRAEDYISEIQAHLPNRSPVTHRPSAPETLQKNGIAPESIEAVSLSHVHWDHHGDPRHFPNATFIVGHGSMEIMKHGMPGRGSHSHFDKNLFSHVRAVELSPPAVETLALEDRGSLPNFMLGGNSKWEALGPFPAAVDVLGDGSVYAISAPGHLPGHTNLLCRTGAKEWTYLGGDAFHDK